MEVYKIIYLRYNNKAAHINFSVFNKMSKLFNQVLIINVSIAEGGHISCIANSTFIYPPPTLTSRISHRICTNYASGPGRPGGAVAPFAPY